MSDKKKRIFDGIILDIDGTLWNTTGIVAVAWNRAIDNSGFDVRNLNAQDLQREFGKTMDVIALDLWGNLSPPDRAVLLAECETEELVMIKEITFDITYPGVIETIKELSSEHNFFIVSNCQKGYIETMLEKTGLTDCIKDFECFGRTGKGKAENIQMLKARNSLSDPIYVGDTQSDADASKQAGIPFVWASYGFGSEVDYCYDKIEKFSDIKNIPGVL